MALYDGFFDAVQDEETQEYDRSYEAGDFTGYFEKVIGSGVCIHNNPDSFKVRLENGKAVVSPGYLFIRGYWLKNDADYPVDIPGSENYAIVAHLNLGKRMIEIEAQSVALSYPDSLVLATVSTTAATDTRHNTDICGVIDTAGELSSKVDWAISYINTEIEGKLAQVEAEIAAKQQELDQEIAAQEAELDAKINEAQQRIDSIIPDPIGTIKFSAAETMGENWLKCDGSYISVDDYPELVEMIGKLEPDLNGFQIVSNGEVGAQISNGVIYDGKMWVYSFSTKKLYGVDLSGNASVKEISVTFLNSNYYSFSAPTTAQPIALSIVPHKAGSGAMLFLGQGFNVGVANSDSAASVDYVWMGTLALVGGEFDPSKSDISLSPPFKNIYQGTDSTYFLTGYKYDSNEMLPYVISRIESGVELYYVHGVKSTSLSSKRVEIDPIRWGNGEYGVRILDSGAYIETTNMGGQRTAFNKKNSNEAVSIAASSINTSYGQIFSVLSGTYSLSRFSGLSSASMRPTGLPLNIVGNPGIIFGFTEKTLPVVWRDGTKVKNIQHNISIPNSSKVFADAGAYLWGRGIYLIFVGTGIVFSKTLEDGSFGYLDTTSVLGTITNFGYMDYSENENTLYLMGQDSSSQVKVAKLEIGDLFEYTTGGALLPNLKMENVPGWIKAKEAAT